MSRPVSLIAGFYLSVEVQTRVRFGRFYANERIRWIPEASRRGRGTPRVDRFESALSQELRRGSSPVCVYLAADRRRGFAEEFQEMISASGKLYPDRIRVVAEIDPADAQTLCNYLVNLFGVSNPDALVTEFMVKTIAADRKILCVSSEDQPRISTIMMHAGLGSPVVRRFFEEMRVSTQQSKIRVAREEVGRISERCDEYSWLIWGLGFSHDILNAFKGRITYDRDSKMAALKFLADLQSRADAHDLEFGAQVQRNLLPSILPIVDGLQLSAAWLPLRMVSGDYFEAFAVGPGQLNLAIADVSGKGLPAALSMAHFSGLIKPMAVRGEKPVAICSEANRGLVSRLLPATYITCFYGDLDHTTLNLRYCNAGHCPPLLLRSDGNVEKLSRGGAPLGLLPEAQYQEEVVGLKPGDTLVLYTDGLTEARNTHSKEFGESGIIDSIRKGASTATELKDAVAEFSRGEFEDDLAILMLRVPGSPRSLT